MTNLNSYFELAATVSEQDALFVAELLTPSNTDGNGSSFAILADTSTGYRTLMLSKTSVDRVEELMKQNDATAAKLSSIFKTNQ